MPTEPIDKRRRFFKNSLFGLLSWLLPVIPTIVATPILLEKLGKEQYGILVVTLGFISYFFTTAVGKVAAKYVAEYEANGERDKISAVISATLIVAISITTIGSLFTIFFARPIVVSLLSIQPEFQDQAVDGLYLASITLIALVFGQVFQFVLQGLHQFDRYLLLTNLTSVSFSLGSIFMASWGYGMIGLLWWNFVTWVLVSVLAYLIVKRSIPEFRFTFSIPREISRVVAGYAISIIAYQIFGNALLLFERGWIIRQFGARELTFYVVPMSLAMLVHVFISSLVLAMFPTVNELLSDRERLRMLYIRVTKLILGLLVFSLLSVAVCGRMFFTVWLGEEYAAASYWLLVIHTVTFTILAMNTVTWQVAESFRGASLNAFATMVWMFVGIVLMIILSGYWQTSGVAIGRLAGVMVFIPLTFYVEKRFLGGGFARFWASAIGRVALAAIPAAAVETVLTEHLPQSWPVFLLTVVAGGLVYLGLLMMTGFFDQSERKMFKELLSSKTGTGDSA